VIIPRCPPNPELTQEARPRLLTLAWWDWPAEHLTPHLRTVMSGSIDDLEAIAPP
jgi:hypothetical protein